MRKPNRLVLAALFAALAALSCAPLLWLGKPGPRQSRRAQRSFGQRLRRAVRLPGQARCPERRVCCRNGVDPRPAGPVQRRRAAPVAAASHTPPVDAPRPRAAALPPAPDADFAYPSRYLRFCRWLI